MLFSWIWTAFANMLSVFLQAMPAPAVPTWLASLPASIATFTTGWSGLGVWLPGSLIASVLVAWPTAYLVGVVIRVGRMSASFLTGGGGSAA